MTVTLNDIEAAAAAIAGAVIDSPCYASPHLSRLSGAEVVLKLENWQFTGSFKERGALYKLLGLSDKERRAGVIAMSAGNHAQAVAHQRLGIPATIVMPEFTPNIKVTRTKSLGATVVLAGAGVAEAGERALVLARRDGLTLIHPYDDARIIAGRAR